MPRRNPCRLPQTISPDTLVTVCRHPADYQRGSVPFGRLTRVHLATFSGGTQAPLPRPMLAAFISCADIVDGSIAHSCMHGPGPHYIKVIVPKTANDKKVVAELCRSAERRSAA